MSLAVTNGVAATITTGTVCTTTTKTTSATGSGFIVGVIRDAGRTVTVTDSKGNTYSQIGTEVDGSANGFRTTLHYIASGTGGSSHTWTATLSGSGGCSMFAGELTTTNGNGVTLDKNAEKADASTPFTSGPTATTTTANEILISLMGSDAGANPSTMDPTANSFALVTNAAITNGVLDWVGALASRSVSATGAYDASWTSLGTPGAAGVHVATFSEAAGSGPATLSSATPSGTLGTQTTATLGATTNQTTGTLYGVVDTSGNISGVTAAQVKAGQKNNSTSALAASNSAISTTTPSTGITGLIANTLYSYALVQNNTNGDTSVLTGTFTTATASGVTLRSLLLMGVG